MISLLISDSDFSRDFSLISQMRMREMWILFQFLRKYIPVFLKMGIITPVYKGGGKDPLDTNNYRGVTVTSVFAKVLESLLLPRLQCHLANRGIPHTNQTAYRKGVSCAEAIFSTLEVLSTYSNKNEKMHMCFYDLQKAFDSIQYPILLKRLFEAGVDGRVWRLLRSWYTSPRCRVKINGSLSSAITLKRGVLQGSVLSPILFLLIMDPLLHRLQCQGLGPSIGETYICRCIHPRGRYTHCQQFISHSTTADRHGPHICSSEWPNIESQ